MKTNSRNGLVSLLVIMLLAGGAGIGNANENLSSSSDTFVYPGVGFDDVKKSNENFVVAYGVIPEFKSEEEKQKFYEKIEEVYESIVDDMIVKDTEIKQHLDNKMPVTTNLYIKTAKEYSINISGTLVEYFGDSIVGGHATDEYIVIDWNIYKNYDYDPKTTTLNEILNNENLTLSEFKGSNIDRKTMDEVYEIHYLRGKEMGIEDIPLVFELGAPAVPLTGASVSQSDTELSVPVNIDEASNKVPVLFFTSVIVILTLAFFISRME